MLTSVGNDATRLGALPDSPGRIGCATLHSTLKTPSTPLLSFRPHVLVVDDSAQTRKQLLAEFDGLGASVEEAEHGVQALASAARRVPDLVTVDIEMPNINGYALCRMLSSNSATVGVPIVMISGKPDEQERLRALEAGAVDYFAKPFAPGTLQKLATDLFTRMRKNRRKRIVSITDQPELHRQLEACFSRHGYHHTVEETPEGLATTQEEQPCDLVVVDLRLANGGGYRLLDTLQREAGRRAPKIVALAPQAARRELVNAYNAGVSDFVRLPFHHEELLARVERQLFLQDEETELRQLATVDALTRVGNRAELSRVAGIEVHRARRTGDPLGVIVADIDHFKRVNDKHGHGIGDQVLREVAVRLRDSLRATDFIGRFGGEEFVILLPSTNCASLKAIAERLRVAVETPQVTTECGKLAVTVSLGCHCWEATQLGPGLELDKLIQHADKALYSAKQLGRNQAQMFRPQVGLRRAL
jgi:two-component system, cell cycle response regulator